MNPLDRRKFVSAVGAGAVGVFATGNMVVGQSRAEAQEPGAHQVQALKYPYDALKGISKQVVTWHHDKHYAGYVKKRNAIEQQLIDNGPGTDNFDARIYAGLKRSESFSASGMILHEVYFDNLGGDGKPGDGTVEWLIKRCFGSMDKWMTDMKTIGGQATGWALCCWDPSDGRMHNYLVDQHEIGAVWAAKPIIALDVFEHAYYHDQGPNRGKYLDAFFDNLHWGRINERYAG